MDDTKTTEAKVTEAGAVQAKATGAAEAKAASAKAAGAKTMGVKTTGAKTAVSARILTRGAVAIAVVGALSAGYVAGQRNLSAPQVIAPAQAAMMPAEAAAKTGIPDFSGLVETYGPAVVNISAKHGARRAARGMQLPVDPNDPFYQFFKHFYSNVPGLDGGNGNGGGDAGQAGASLGSGFIISPDGYVLTNAHVVDGADTVTVKLTDKREFKAKVVGADKQSDVAVLKIDATGLPVVKIGNPDQSKVGQWVAAIGSPYGFENSVTAGIISAKSRSLPDESYTPFIQTDVPVNPGNSGGPLFNLQGEVIGINSIIYSQTGGFQGLSFAIPINEAMKVKDDLVRTGHVSRGRLGVAVQSLNQTLADSFGLTRPQGALVSSVDRDGPAGKAGLRPGDVILAVNGQKVNDSTDLPTLIAGIAPGSRASVQVWRERTSKNLDVTIGALGDTKTAQTSDTKAQTQARLGVAVRPLTPQEKNSASLAQGLLVEQSSGAAESAGIQPGDVILAVNGQSVSNVEQLQQIVARAGNSIALLIQRDDTQIFVPVDLG